MRDARWPLAPLLIFGGCLNESNGYHGGGVPLGCTSGGVIDPEPTSSMFDEISVFGTVNLGNCDGAIDKATVTVMNLTTSVAGSGTATDPYCAAFLREYDVWANAPLQRGQT